MVKQDVYGRDVALTRPEAVARALLVSGGAAQAVHTEDVALAAAKLVPGMFAWEHHPERIDKELVRVALSDARLKKGWVIGSHQDGWMLTPEGLAFAERAARVGEDGGLTPRRSKDGRASSRERARLKATEAYEVAVSSGLGTITDDQADAFFRLNVYVRGHARERKIAQIQNEFGDDPELGELVAALADRAKERN